MSFSFRLMGRVRYVLQSLQRSESYGADEMRAKMIVATELGSYNPEQGVFVEASGHEYVHHTGIKQGGLNLKIEAIDLCEERKPTWITEDKKDAQSQDSGPQVNQSMTGTDRGNSPKDKDPRR